MGLGGVRWVWGSGVWAEWRWDGVRVGWSGKLYVVSSYTELVVIWLYVVRSYM